MLSRFLRRSITEVSPLIHNVQVRGKKLAMLPLIAIVIVLIAAPLAHAVTAQFSYALLTLGGGFNLPNGIAVDSVGNVFVADLGDKSVKEIPLGCASSSCVVTLGGGFSFGSPYGVALDGAGNLFVADVNNNAVYELPVVDSYNTVNTLPITFPGATAVAVDGSGNLYVTDSATAVQKIPVGCTTSSCVVALGGGLTLPQDLVLDGHGNIFVADSSGAVKEISPGCTTSSCVKTLGGGFVAPYGVAVDASGDIFVTEGTGNVAKEIPPGCVTSTCVQTLPYVGFTQPGAIRVDTYQSLYIADFGASRVVELEIFSVNFGTVAIGQTGATIPLTFTITADGTIGGAVALTQGTTGLDFAIASGGTCTAATYSAGDTCTVNATFTPMLAGQRNGAVLLQDGTGNTIATAYVHGIGSGPQVEFMPGSQSTLASSFATPYAVAVDGSGNVFVADAGTSAVKEILAGGTVNTLSLSGSFDFPEGIAVDGSGNIFVADTLNNAVKEIPFGCASTDCIKTLGSGFNFPEGIAVDGSGNVFVADTGNSKVKEILAASGYITVNTLGSGFHSPSGVAVDGSGNVFLTDTGNNVVRELLAAGGYTTSKTLFGSFHSPTGIAVDGTGNVFIADTINNAVKEILAAGGYSKIITLASGFNFPHGVAVDGSGNVFVADTSNNQVVKLDYADAPTVNFGVVNVGGKSANQTVTLRNIGNASLLFPVPTAGINPSIAPSFNLDSSAATACPVVTTSSAAGILAPYASCTLAINFAPTLASTYLGAVLLTDNALNAASPTFATQSITLQGTGRTPVLAALTTPAPSSTLSGSSVTFSWTPATGATAYLLYLGTTPGAHDLFNSGSLSTTTTSVTATGLPTNGVKIYATLYSAINIGWKPAYYTYTEAGMPVPAALTTPTPSSTLSGSSVTFNWTPGTGVTAYMLFLGTTPGSRNLFNSGSLTTTSAVVTGLPRNGVKIYATLQSMIGGSWKITSYTYTEAGTPVLAALTTPTPSSTLSGSSVTFTWTPGGGATAYLLYLGTTQSSHNLFSSGSLTTTSVPVTGLPTNGSKIYATLYSMINGAWAPAYYTYTAAP